LYSRNENDFSPVFSQISEELAGINADFVIDGEVCFVENANP
jgi:ATP-dependent DNA ligase